MTQRRSLDNRGRSEAIGDRSGHLRLGGRAVPAQPVAVVGVADHSGWVVLVTAAAVQGEPVLVDRRRVALIEDGVPSQPFHHETLAMNEPDAEQLLRRVKRSIAAYTARALGQLAADLEPQFRVAAIAIRIPPLPRLPATVKEAHASYTVTCRADGMLYHSAICAGARRRGWDVELHERGEEVPRAAKAAGSSRPVVERYVEAIKDAMGPPWAAEHRAAFAAAIGVLGGYARFQIPGVTAGGRRA